jgi:transposase
VLSVEDWAEIRRLHRAEQMSISEVARVVGCSRNTVRAAVASDAPPKFQREPAGSIVDVVEPRIPGAAAGVSDDACHGDRRADRLDSLDPCA